jgi:hypothetical protein
MEVSAGQELRLPVVEPFFFDQCLAFRAVPVPAGVVGDTLKTAFIALFDMTAQGCGPAMLYMAHYFTLGRGCLDFFSEGFTIHAKNVSDLVSGVFCIHDFPSILS